MNEIAVIGKSDIISLFKLYGADCYYLTGNGEEIFKQVYQKNYKIIFVTEEIYKEHKHLIKEDVTFPQITIIPDVMGSKGLGKERIQRFIIKALGADIIETG